ncbi:uncharacterized protein LOC143617109 [Bidens hawaiensis]|uniref:uncharacterized protein LOC143617109 n=1 Tax=Bidens hawaiensis TaxID=980011 RepID=UPI00404B18B1
MLGRLPNFKALEKRNIPVASNMCPFCGEVKETVEHVMVSCGLAQYTWSVLAQWCKMPTPFLFSFRDVLELHKFSRFEKEKADVIHAVCLIVAWCLWKKRNALVCKGIPTQVAGLVEEIKVLSFLWIKHRGRKNWRRFNV